jgi:hypothetical protein
LSGFVLGILNQFSGIPPAFVWIVLGEAMLAPKQMTRQQRRGMATLRNSNVGNKKGLGRLNSEDGFSAGIPVLGTGKKYSKTKNPCA